MANTTPHAYIVTQSDSQFTSGEVLPTVRMTIKEDASLQDHLDAFTRFLVSIGFELPPNVSLAVMEEEIETEKRFGETKENETDHGEPGLN